MIVDAHNHPDWHGHDLERTLHNMDLHGIDRAWLLSWEAPDDEWDPAYNRAFVAESDGPAPFFRCLSYQERAPGRFVLGYAPDPRRPGAVDRLQAAVEIHGVQVYGELKLRMMYDNPDALRMYRFCGEVGLPVVVHIDYELDAGSRYPRPNWWYGGGIEALARAVRSCPETTFVGHGPGFWAHISDDLRYAVAPYPTGAVIPNGRVPALMDEHPNLWADLSAESGRNALVRDREHGARFVSKYADRLLFARDSFNGRLMEALRALDLDASVLSKLLHENAQRIMDRGSALRSRLSAASTSNETGQSVKEAAR